MGRDLWFRTRYKKKRLPQGHTESHRVYSLFKFSRWDSVLFGGESNLKHDYDEKIDLYVCFLALPGMCVAGTRERGETENCADQ